MTLYLSSIGTCPYYRCWLWTTFHLEAHGTHYLALRNGKLLLPHLLPSTFSGIITPLPPFPLSFSFLHSAPGHQHPPPEKNLQKRLRSRLNLPPSSTICDTKNRQRTQGTHTPGEERKAGIPTLPQPEPDRHGAPAARACSTLRHYPSPRAVWACIRGREGDTVGTLLQGVADSRTRRVGRTMACVYYLCLIDLRGFRVRDLVAYGLRGTSLGRRCLKRAPLRAGRAADGRLEERPEQPGVDIELAFLKSGGNSRKHVSVATGRQLEPSGLEGNNK